LTKVIGAPEDYGNNVKSNKFPTNYDLKIPQKIAEVEEAKSKF
jgi:hypothetical protein